MMEILVCFMLLFSKALSWENSDDFINSINKKQNLWTAGRNFPEGSPLLNSRHLLGVKNVPDNILKSIPIKDGDVNELENIPETFDARIQWPKCKSIPEIVDQSSCGSCWAVSVATAISDRICIDSNGKLQPEVSAKRLIACSPDTYGCEGGFPYHAWQYWISDGIVTGGPFGSNIGCQPYPFPQCAHSMPNSTKPQCVQQIYKTPECLQKCDNSTLNFTSDLSYGASAYAIRPEEKLIQNEIMNYGPVVAVFAVYSDFAHYKSGVYFKTAGKVQSRHAVRVIGWGVENGTKYWLAVNSWNEEWGDKGLFKIRRGVNECDFESMITAGVAS